jgi:hypothetical protein
MFGTRITASAAPTVGKTASFTVSAAENAPTPNPVPVADTSTSQTVSSSGLFNFSLFNINKTLTIGLLGLFAFVLAIDIFVVNRKSLIRWTGKSFAHLVFVVLILVAVTTVIGGKIL